MALAQFFPKTALAAAQVLRGFNPDAFAANLNREVIALVFDDHAALSGEGIVTLEIVTDLLARLYPALVFAPRGAAATDLAERLRLNALSINPLLDISTDAKAATFRLVVGSSIVEGTVPTVYLGSDGWLAKISPENPVRSGDSRNPFGAAVAACLGGANVFRAVFNSQLEAATLDSTTTLSVLDLTTNPVNPHNPILDPVDIGSCWLVGVGAIGNGAVRVLSFVPELSGILHLVDRETIDLGNLQRYLLAVESDIGRLKVDLAAGALARTKLDVIPHAFTWGEYLQNTGSFNLPRVLSALDSADARCAVQASLPAWIANAWTQAGDLGVSRHALDRGDACLTCLYLPTSATKSEDQLIAEAIGLPQTLLEVRQLLLTGQGVSFDLVNRIATALSIPPAALVPFVDKPIRTFYTDAICAGITLAAGGQHGGTMEAPLAFQSTLAGILLAAELIADAGGFRETLLPTVSRVDLLRPLPPRFSARVARHSSGRCICQDADYVETYRRKYDRHEFANGSTPLSG